MRRLGWLRVLRRNPKLTAGVTVLVLVCAVGFANEPLISLIRDHLGADPLAYSPEHWGPPSGQHWLGTDQYGRDVLALVLEGLATSLKIGAIAGVLSTVIAVVVAFVAAYRGGAADTLLSTVTDFVLVIPSLPLLLAYAAFAKQVGLVQISVVLALFSWPGAARRIRSQVLSLRDRPYVDLAKVTKQGSLEIIATELVPNMLPYIALGLAYAAVASMFALIGLEVIGLGPSSVVDLGFVLNMAVSSGAMTLGAWGVLVAPILIATSIFFALTLINVGLEEVCNPRLRQTAGV